MRTHALAIALATFALLACSPARAAGLTGTVLDPQGKPVPGAVVYLFGGGGSQAPATTTDRHGAYAFSALAPGQYSVRVYRRGFAAQQQSAPLSEGTGSVELNFRMEPWQPLPGSITGTVRRADTGAPIPGASVALYAVDPRVYAMGRGPTLTDSDGWFETTHLRAGSYRLHGDAPGYSGLSAPVITLSSDTDHQEVEALLSPDPAGPPGTVRGRLLDAAGKPLAFRSAWALVWGYTLSSRLRVDGLSTPSSGGYGSLAGSFLVQSTQGMLTTDAEGGFRLSATPGSYVVKLWVEGYPAHCWPVAVPPASSGEARDFRLLHGTHPDPWPRPGSLAAAPARSRLSGVVLRPDGAPLAHAHLYVFVRPAPVALTVTGMDMLMPALADATTDAEGRFERANLPAGPATVVVKSRGFAATERVSVHLPADGTASATFRLPGPAAWLSGRVASPDGEPLPGVLVYAYRVRGNDEALDQLASLGVARLRALASAVVSHQRRLAMPQLGVRPGSPVPDAIPCLARDGVFYAETGPDGRFSLAELDAGVYHVAATREGWSWEAHGHVAVPAGSPPPEMSFTLARVGSFEGILIRPDGRPLAGALIRAALGRVEPAGEWPPNMHRSLQTDTHGRYRLDGLSPGVYRLRTLVPGYRDPGWDRLLLGPGETVPLQTRLQDGLVLRGRVLRPDGAPAAWALVGCRQERDGLTETTHAAADAEGRFQALGLDPGEALLEARVAGFAPAEARVALPSREPVVLRLHPGVTVTGTARDAAGKPLFGVRISWSAPDAPPSLFDPYRSTQTDSSGRYALVDLPAGKLVLTATHPAAGSATVTRDSAGESGEAVVDLVLRPSGG